MSIRLLIAGAVQVVSFLFSLLGWMDPLEGGSAVAMSALVMGVSYLIGRVRIPKLTWISVAATLALAATIVGMILAAAPATGPTGGQATAQIPDYIRALLWVYEAGSVAVMAGQAFYAVRIFAARRALNA
jgi:hypothetical protein